MERLYAGRFVNLVREGHWEFCERVNNTPAAMIFARTEEDRVLLVEEFRPAIGKQSICFPAGLIGDEGEESAVEAARRELLEETGYDAASVRLLSQVRLPRASRLSTSSSFSRSSCTRSTKGAASAPRKLSCMRCRVGRSMTGWRSNAAWVKRWIRAFTPVCT